MTDKTPMHPDDELLIDYHSGQLSDEQIDAIDRRLKEDEAFAERSVKVGSMLGILHACPAPEPSEFLVAKTIAAVKGAATTRSLLDREAFRVRPFARATFSMKELGAVAALLFICGAILLPAFRHAGALARQQACVAQTGAIGASLTQFANDHNGFLPGMAERNASWLGGGEGTISRSNSRNLWRLVHGRYAKALLFQCPAVGGGHTIDAAEMTMMPDFPGRDYIDYSYHNSVNTDPLRIDALAPVASRMAILADRTPMFEQGRFYPSRLKLHNSMNHHQQGQSVLFLDMHAEWAKTSRVGVNGDDIWLVKDIYEYRGTEQPANATDSFLLPSYIETPK